MTPELDRLVRLESRHWTAKDRSFYDRLCRAVEERLSWDASHWSDFEPFEDLGLARLVAAEAVSALLRELRGRRA